MYVPLIRRAFGVGSGEKKTYITKKPVEYARAVFVEEKMTAEEKIEFAKKWDKGGEVGTSTNSPKIIELVKKKPKRGQKKTLKA